MVGYAANENWRPWFYVHLRAPVSPIHGDPFAGNGHRNFNPREYRVGGIFVRAASAEGARDGVSPNESAYVPAFASDSAAPADGALVLSYNVARGALSTPVPVTRQVIDSLVSAAGKARVPVGFIIMYPVNQGCYVVRAPDLEEVLGVGQP